MKLQKQHLADLEYLTAITSLLHRIRREDRSAGLYEAADLQWWWREDEFSNPRMQTFWLDEADDFVASLLLYDEGERWICDFFRLPSFEARIASEVLPDVLEIISNLPNWSSMLLKSSIVTVRDDDVLFRESLEKRGWQESGESTIQTILEIEPTQPSQLPEGFYFKRRAEATGLRHPMTVAGRNPINVESRLAQCSLYRPGLDYAVFDPSNETAAYALFWIDPETKVGLIEPLRTVKKFQRMGIGRAIVHEGIRRLREEGANEIKVSYKADNEPARRLYHSCGFRDAFRKIEYRLHLGSG